MNKCNCLDAFNWYKGKDGRHHEGCSSLPPLTERLYQALMKTLNDEFDHFYRTMGVDESKEVGRFNRSMKLALKQAVKTKYL